MTSPAGIIFTPPLGTTLRVSRLSGATLSLFATSPKSVNLVAEFGDGTTIPLEQTDTPAVGGLLTYKVTIPKPNRVPACIRLRHADGKSISDLGSGQDILTLIDVPTISSDREFSTSITLSASEDTTSMVLDWLNDMAWQGWAWQRMRPTWIEAQFVTCLSTLAPDKLTHCLLLRPSDTKQGEQLAPETVLAVFPASSNDAFVTLTGPRDNEAPGVYARVRRVGAVGKDIAVHVTGSLKARKGEETAIHDAVQLARRLYGLTPTRFEVTAGKSPFDRLGFCTWSSIGENVPLNKTNMTELTQLLKKDAKYVPVGSFIIDDGWQDIRHGLNGHPNARGLWSFDTWDGMGCSLADLVAMIKTELTSVKEVGVWMTLTGYWNSVAPGSPLETKYGMVRYNIARSNVPGQDWTLPDFDNQQSGTINDAEGRYYLLPPPERAAEFWSDYFGTCAAAGVDFVKVDNQAYGSFLEGVQGGQEFVALWDAMFTAANQTFGHHRVIHCMAHYERIFSGDIGLGAATNNQKIVIRNSDDFGLDRPDVHRDHIHYNLYNALLLDQLSCIPDADMFMTSAQWPQYHAVLRAFFSHGPVLLADLPGTWDVEVVKKLIAPDTKGECTVVRGIRTARPLPRNIWEKTLDHGPGPSIKAASPFGKHGAAIILWNARTGARDNTADILFKGDIIDTLGEVVKGPGNVSNNEYALWLSNANRAASFQMEQGIKETLALDTERMNAVLSVSLPPATMEIVTVAPLWRIGNMKIAVLGLVDKYAGLSAIKNTWTEEDGVVTEVRLAGELGILLHASSTDSRPRVMVDGELVSVIERRVGLESNGDDPSLLTVDLTEINSVDGKDFYTVQVRF
ncbi:uncharacterized protein N7458_001509 [Penicillium daleae]|uniref:Alpha-galactosidase n=1 Tax=Penicillium daleae TaxID=63821 RepID=A0AAD6CBA7_9EURO|nr:uncharacterized protein N7458_001509 [Penicillium daleae]KAJ5459957.1 hypothetical protein N7458_001509 [Penicillium daleae]